MDGKAVARSRNGRGGRIREATMSPRLPAPAALDPDSFLANAPSADAKLRPTVAPGSSPDASKSAQVWSAAAREANRFALDGVRLIREGHPAEAVPLLQRSLELDPGVAASHLGLGVALMATGRLEQAAEAFAAALRLNPGMAIAHHFLGYIFDNLGQQAKAMARYQAAVALKPDFVAAWLRLGEIYQSRRLRAPAAAAFRAAAAAAKGTAMASIAEACALEASGAFDEALAAMRAVVEAHPTNAEAHAVLGRLLGKAGLSAEAAAHHLRVAELLPELRDAWAGVAINKRFTAEDGGLIARMNAALTSPKATPRDRRTLHFALGKAHDDMGNYEEAMRNFEAGNRLRALSGGLKRDALVRHIDRLIAATPPGYRDRQPDAGVEDATPILIVGMPRSGSTLIEQVLSSHPEVAAGGEMEFWRVRDTPRQDIWD